MKSKALKGGPVASDVRTWHMRLIKSAGVAATVGLLYPRMLPIHTLAPDAGFGGQNGKLVMPPLMRTSYARMEPHGAYLIGPSMPPTRVVLTRSRERRDRDPVARRVRLAPDSAGLVRSREPRRA